MLNKKFLSYSEEGFFDFLKKKNNQKKELTEEEKEELRDKGKELRSQFYKNFKKLEKVQSQHHERIKELEDYLKKEIDFDTFFTTDEEEASDRKKADNVNSIIEKITDGVKQLNELALSFGMKSFEKFTHSDLALIHPFTKIEDKNKLERFQKSLEHRIDIDLSDKPWRDLIDHDLFEKYMSRLLTECGEECLYLKMLYLLDVYE